jgi:DNA modification methylase
MRLILLGDALENLAAIRDCSVDCVVTSPPYYRQRDYGVPGQWGLEQNLKAHVERMVTLFAEVRRVLRPRGTLWLNYGDTYSAGGRGGGGLALTGWNRAWTHAARANKGWAEERGFPRKSLLGVPWRVALALQDDGWLLRQDIVWAKTTPHPERCTDRFTRSHEYVFLLTRRSHYDWNREAAREMCESDYWQRAARVAATIRATGPEQNGSSGQHSRKRSDAKAAAAMQDGLRNMRSVWSIRSEGFPGAHFATMPLELARRCIAIGCPPGGLVFDPFAGAGTTGVAALSLDRRFVGIELSPNYHALAMSRLAQKTIMEEVL